MFCPLTSAWRPQIEYLQNAAIMDHPLFFLPPLSYFHPTTVLQYREPHALLHNRPASISRLFFFFFASIFLSLPCFNLPVFHHFFSVLSLTSGAGQYELPTKYKWSTFLPNGRTEKHLFLPLKTDHCCYFVNFLVVKMKKKKLLQNDSFPRLAPRAFAATQRGVK